VFRAEGIRIVLTAPQAPRMNAIMERWVGSVRRGLLDRIHIVNAAHLRKVLTEYESHFNASRPHRALKQTSALRALPDPVDADIKVTRRDRLGGLLREDQRPFPTAHKPLTSGFTLSHSPEPRLAAEPRGPDRLSTRLPYGYYQATNRRS
jgi:hypothetical protein